MLRTTARTRTAYKSSFFVDIQRSNDFARVNTVQLCQETNQCGMKLYKTLIVIKLEFERDRLPRPPSARHVLFEFGGNFL